MAENIIIKLQCPIPLKTKGTDGKSVTSSIDMVQLSPIKAKHLKFLPKSMFNAGGSGKNKKDLSIDPYEMLPLVGALTGLPKTAVDDIDIKDLMVIMEKIGELMGE